jgi:adenylate cyclase
VVHRAALAAAREGIAAVQTLNETWLARTHCPIGCGVALHVGKVSYGNIGAADRLDFTVIGPAVNLAARLEQLTRRVGTRLVLSEDFARALTETVVPLGEFALKGISKGQLVFGFPQPVGGPLPPTRGYPSTAAGPRIESDTPEAP